MTSAVVVATSSGAASPVAYRASSTPRALQTADVSAASVSVQVTVPQVVFAEPVVQDGHVTVRAVITGGVPASVLNVSSGRVHCSQQLVAGVPTACILPLGSVVVARVHGPGVQAERSWRPARG